MRTPIRFGASVIALSLATGVATLGATAQETGETEDEARQGVIVVTGIRGSLSSAADIKRNADGVVDAISAEDIGKFPDANLAESLQRITGVSIDRQNNEGNQISVRGLGPSFNLVTLNGRQMPSASSPEIENISSATQSRAFNFAEIASESVAGVNVYKTARADLPTGGIGATVDIRTTRPFDLDPQYAFVSAAAIFDPTAEADDGLTPEIGGIFSKQFNDQFAFLINGSYSERNFRDTEDHLDGWDRYLPGSGGYDGLVANGLITGTEPVVYAPRTNISEISDNRRTRINGQAVAQFRPSSDVTVTADYTLSRFEREEDRYSTGMFGLLTGINLADISNLQLTSNGSFSSYDRINVATDAIAYANELIVENDSFGLNIEWDVSEKLSFEFDAHSSTAESQPGGEVNDLLALYQGPLGVAVSIDYGSSNPTIIVDDSGAFRGVDQFGGGAPRPNVTSFQDPDGFSPLGTFVRNVAVENTVDQIQFNGSWRGDADSLIDSINFGVSYTDYEVSTDSASSGFVFQNLDACTACDQFNFQNVPVGTSFDTITTFDVPAAIESGFPIPFSSIVPALENNTIKEESLALFASANLQGEFNGMPTRLNVGLRYESTDVEGTSVAQNTALALQTTSLSEQQVINSTVVNTFSASGDYQQFLPSLDFQIEPYEDVLLRASYGRTLARPDLNALRPVQSVADTRPFGPFNAVSGNPDLLPYLSDNFDLAAEWYYEGGSYVAVNYFHKSIQNYIGTRNISDTILNSNGQPLTDPSPRFVPATSGDPGSGAVTSLPTDPVALFTISQAFNSGDAKIDGFEFAIQHLFGETGFGVQANYTLVDSDAEFDPTSFVQTVNLIGLSDSANLVGFYEADRWQVRAALNWRDEFLFSENQLRTAGEPVFFDAFTQIDVSGSFDVTDQFSVFAEVLNMTGEDQLQRGRFEDQFLFNNDQEPRYTVGGRYTF